MNLVESTNPKTVRVAHQAKWINYRGARFVHPRRTWIFTDGSSLGGFGAVVLRENEPALELKDFAEPTSTKNVGAELNGFLLGLHEAREGEKLIVVSDYLGIAAWMTGNWKIKDPEVYNKIQEARGIVLSRGLDVDFIHHGGHQKDASDFTRWNSRADVLASEANPGK